MTEATTVPPQAAEAEPAAPANAPRRWVWSAMDPTERQQRLVELAVWVDWLVETHEMTREIPRCWYRHKRVLEVLTALYLGWVRTYAGDPTKTGTLGEVDWITRLHTLAPRLAAPSCTEKHRSWGDGPEPTGQELSDWLDVGDTEWLEDQAYHPAQAEANRLAAAAAAAKAEAAARAKTGARA
ncbi:hypothetical protein OG618_37520 (plasmid) [Kitasatospora sp. NBC_01246]|uniref:hypothetical protein n=1 Tax=Kitasatospora sp. NBC_01246 TaxID=2903570 RepID=UPI002E3709C4|nr:hypothetical protein [Kitasatospora sp. NBC_01246]